MINVTVVSFKKILKYVIGIIILIFMLFGINQLIKGNKEIDEHTNPFDDISFVSCIKSTLPKIEERTDLQKLEDGIQKTTSRSSGLRKMLQVELQMLDILKEDKEEDEIQKEDNKDQQVELAKTDVGTKEVTNHNIVPKYNDVYGSVKIKNESNKEITQETLTPNISLENKKDVIIFHTHTCESYTPSEKFNYEMTGSYRTTDLNFTVARVGRELDNQLKEYGFSVTHDETYHDYPEYSGSYGKSLGTVKNILSSKPETQMVIDLHRDAVGSKPDYAPCVQIGDETAAQLMFVIGTDGGGLQHLNWQQNLKFAVKVQQKADELYPGLFRPIIVRNSRYNQHLTKAATIIEVGATGNTLDQCLVSMKYLAKILNEINQ